MRAKVLVPLVLAFGLVLAYGLSRFQWLDLGMLGFLGALALLLIVSMVNSELFALRPVERLIAFARDPAPAVGVTPALQKPQPLLGEIATDLIQLKTTVREQQSALDGIKRELSHSVQARREAEERYTIAVDRANDGFWDWDLNTDAARFSPRWCGMLGYSDTAMGRVDAWKQLIHPDDAEAVLMRIQNHLQGTTPQFNAEYRLRHRDGRYRWVHSRGVAIRHASGKPYRMIVMDHDTNSRKEIEQTLIAAAEGLSSVSGQEFFHALVTNLCSVLGTRDALACYCLDDPPTRVRTLAFYSGGQFAEENFEYDLAETSCGAVIDRREIVYCPTGLCDIWPFEKRYDRDSYLGVPMFDSTGKIIGHFACADPKPMRQDLPHLAIFKIFAVRAAAELERTLLKQKLASS